MLWHKAIGAGGTGGAPEGSWDITTLSYTGNSYSLPDESTPRGLTFKSDGTKVYYVGLGLDRVYERPVTTAWDITTVASFNINTLLLGSGAIAEGLFFKPDGTKLYVTDSSTSDRVRQYSLSTAWSLVSTSLDTELLLGTFDPTGIFMDSTGTRMYILNDNNEQVTQFSLSTAWDISTASSVQSFSYSTYETSAGGISFKPDGTRMYINGRTSDAIHQYNLSTAWDISTASYVSNASVSSQDGSSEDIYIRDDGLKLYMLGNGNDSIYEYDLT